MLLTIQSLLEEASELVNHLDEKINEARQIDDIAIKAEFYRDVIFVLMEKLRAKIDSLEMYVDKSVWPVPSYADILFKSAF